MKPSLTPVPPAHLSPEARGVFSRIVEGLDLDATMTLILESALEAFDRMRAAQGVIASEGLIVFDPPQATESASRRYHRTGFPRCYATPLKSLGLDLNRSPLRKVG